MSTYNAPIIKLNFTKHPDADTLSIQRIDDFVVVAKTADWEGITHGIYIPPDSIVDTTRKEFAWLDPNGLKVRVKAKKLRGVWSMGLMIPAPEGAVEGEDYYERLGVEHYEPPEEGFGGTVKHINAPDGYTELTKFDVENGRKTANSRYFTANEPVIVTEKIHGQNMAFCYTAGDYHVRSRNLWNERDAASLYWKSVTPNMMAFAKENEGLLLYGEQYGHIKGFPYDCKPGQVKFRAFDIRRRNGDYLGSEEFYEFMLKYDIDYALVVDVVPFDMEKLLTFSEGKSQIGSKIMEGVVVKPIEERKDMRHGRIIIKLINPAYLEKN